MTVDKYLDSKQHPYQPRRQSNGLEYIMNCPFCEDSEKKFAVNAESGAFNCFHKNKCGVSGSFWELQEKWGDKPVMLDKDIKYMQIKKDYKQPEKGQTIPVTTPVLDWLHYRGITDETIKKFTIRESMPGWVVFPYIKNGIALNLKQRSIKDKKFINTPGKEPSLFNRDNISGTAELNIVEGEMDCLAMDVYNIHSVSVPDGAGSDNWIDLEWDFLKKFDRINLILDRDEAGKKGNVKLCQRLGEDRCFEVILPYKDANECLMKGVTENEVNSCLDNARHFPIEGLEDASFFTDQILHDLNHPEEMVGIDTPFSGLTRIIKGFRMSELTVIAGSNHSGKSTWLGQVINYLARKDHKICLASLEMPPKQSLKWMIKQEVFQGQLTPQGVKDVMEKNFAGKLVILDTVKSVTPEFLFKAWELSARRHGTKFFILDSLMRITLPNKDQYKAQSEFISQLVAFAHEWKCHIFMVAHVRKAERDNYTSGKVDIAGTADITNLAHNVIMMKRIEYEEAKKIEEEAASNNITLRHPDTEIAVKKCREIGIVDKFLLSFDYESKVFSEVI